MESETLLQGEKEQGQGYSYLDSLKSFARRGFETPGGAGESAPGGWQTEFQRGKGWGYSALFWIFLSIISTLPESRG
jgi:hypothetical protein